MKEHYGVVPTIKKSPNKKLVLRLAFSFSVLIIVIATILTTFYFLNDKDDNADIGKTYYQKQNEVITESTFQDILNSVNGFSLTININAVDTVYLVSDSVSGDKLYYKLLLDEQDNFILAEIFIVINTNYEFDFRITEELHKNSQINGFQVEYSEQIAVDDEYGIYLITAKATISTAHETIYINFSAYSIDDNSPFTDWLESLIQPR